MCPILILYLVWKWLLEHEQSVAIWLEGLALVAIFALELKEYFRQGRDRKEQHEQTLAQMEIMRNQALATDTAAKAALLTAQSLVNSERAWIKVVVQRKGYDYFIKLRNVGRTPARIVGYDFAVCMPPFMKFGDADLFVLQETDKAYGAFVAPKKPLNIEIFILDKIVPKDRLHELEKTSTNKSSLILKGRIRYRDVVNDTEEHLTTFFFYLAWDGFTKPSQPEYNTYT
jgi:hypothetical protein